MTGISSKNSNIGQVSGSSSPVSPASSVLLDPANWEDLRVSIASLFPRGAGLDPARLQWNAGSILTFNTDDEISFLKQMPHNYKEGTDLLAHIHWTPHSRGVLEAAKTVNWQLELSVANIDTVFPAPSFYPIPVVCSGIINYHEISASVIVPGVGLKISHILQGTIRRIAGDTWVGGPTTAQRPGLLEFDFHYQKNTLGSTTPTSK